jgi:hypothetical protein
MPKSKFIFTFVFLALPLAACVQDAAQLNSIPNPVVGEPYMLTSTDEVVVKNTVTKGFKDPVSAQFENLKAARSGVKVTVCGQVNGKNGYGAYAGFSPFIVFLNPQANTAAITELASGDASSEQINRILNSCRAAGAI